VQNGESIFLLIVDFEVILGVSGSPNESELTSLVSKWEESLDAFLHIIIPEITHSESADSNSSVPKWKLLWTALILVFVAVLSTVLVQITRWWHRPMGYKRQRNPGGESLAEDSSVKTPPPTTSNGSSGGHPGENFEVEIEHDDFLEIIDNRSTFSWYVPKVDRTRISLWAFCALLTFSPTSMF